MYCPTRPVHRRRQVCNARNLQPFASLAAAQQLAAAEAAEVRAAPAAAAQAAAGLTPAAAAAFQPEVVGAAGEAGTSAVAGVEEQGAGTSEAAAAAAAAVAGSGATAVPQRGDLQERVDVHGPGDAAGHSGQAPEGAEGMEVEVEAEEERGKTAAAPAAGAGSSGQQQHGEASGADTGQAQSSCGAGSAAGSEPCAGGQPAVAPVITSRSTARQAAAGCRGPGHELHGGSAAAQRVSEEEGMRHSGTVAAPAAEAAPAEQALPHAVFAGSSAGGVELLEPAPAGGSGAGKAPAPRKRAAADYVGTADALPAAAAAAAPSPIKAKRARKGPGGGGATGPELPTTSNVRTPERQEAASMQALAPQPEAGASAALGCMGPSVGEVPSMQPAPAAGRPKPAGARVAVAALAAPPGAPPSPAAGPHPPPAACEAGGWRPPAGYVAADSIAPPLLPTEQDDGTLRCGLAGHSCVGGFPCGIAARVGITPRSAVQSRPGSRHHPCLVPGALPCARTHSGMCP